MTVDAAEHTRRSIQRRRSEQGATKRGLTISCPSFVRTRCWQNRCIGSQLLQFHLPVPLGSIAGAVVKIEADERETDTRRLHGSSAISEPNDRDDDNEDAFDQ